MLVRRTLENLQDVIVSLVLVLLLVLSLQSIWRLARMALIEVVAPNQLLSEVIFVLILTELYRLLIFYLRDHRVSVALMVEVALVSTLREVMLKGAHEFEWLRLSALSLLLLVLGGLLAAERWMGSWRNEVLRNRRPLTARSSGRDGDKVLDAGDASGPTRPPARPPPSRPTSARCREDHLAAVHLDGDAAGVRSRHRASNASSILALSSEGATRGLIVIRLLTPFHAGQGADGALRRLSSGTATRPRLRA